MKKFVSIVLALMMLVLPVSAGAVEVDTSNLYTWSTGTGYIPDIEFTEFPNDVDFYENTRLYLFISAAASLGLMNLDENGNFNPNEYVTRAEAAAILDRLPLPYVYSAYIMFKDNSPSKWYYEAVQDVGALIGGTYVGPSVSDPSNRFYPEQRIEKEDFILGIYNRLNNSSADGWFNGFTDPKYVTNFAERDYKDYEDITRIHPSMGVETTEYIDAINQLVCQGIVWGDKDGYFRPHSALTRAQVVEMIMITYDTFRLDNYHPWGSW